MQEFENRLRKNFKHISKWARRQNITCFRVYDLDIPNFPLCVEIYGEYVHVSEYTKPKMKP
jgi:23S rRNA G2069 N7-methylase RlmK/C1962 C5-methylase RlmI